MRNLLNKNGIVRYTNSMSIFQNQHNPQAAQFLAEFSTKVNDEAISTELATLSADQVFLDSLNLKQLKKTDAGIWGLLVICKKNAYFYVHQMEPVVFNMVMQGNKMTIPEQVLCLTKLQGLSVTTLQKTVWNILDSDRKYTLVFSFKDEHQSTHTFNLRTQHESYKLKDTLDVLLMQ